jgi:branched-subunit amino acid ABC-type transport system permease component
MLYVSAIISGLAVGGIYAIIGVGITQIFKVTRVLNFAHAGFVLWGAYLYAQFSATWKLPVLLAAAVTILCVAAMGVVAEFIVFRIGSRASNANKIIITFGLLQILLALAIWVWGQDPYAAAHLVPSGGVEVFGTQVTYSQITNIGCAAILVVGLGAFLRYTRIGLLTRAIAEDAAMAEILGARRARLGAFSWALGAGMGGLAGILVTNLGPFTNDQFVPYFTVALLGTLLGGLQSLPLSVLGGLVVGVIYQVSGARFTALYSPQAILFVGVVALVLLRRRWPDQMSKISWSKPAALRDGSPSWILFYEHIIVLAAAWIALLVWVLRSAVWAQTGGLIVVYGLAAVSLVPILGWCGQISLGQGGLMGIGAFTLASATSYYQLPFFVGLILAIAAGAVAGGILGGITSRLSFVLTAITTLAFTEGVRWFLNGGVFHSIAGALQVVAPSWIGTPSRQFFFFAVCAILVMLALHNVKRSAWGARFLSVKTAPVMAQHFGVAPVRMRIYAFALSGAVAGLAGGLYALTIGVVSASGFGDDLSLQVLQYGVIGGTGAVWGPFIATITFIGFPQLINLNRWGALPWPNLLGGLGVVQMMSISEDGVTHIMKPPTHKLPATRLGRRLGRTFGYLPPIVALDSAAASSSPPPAARRPEKLSA